MSGLKSQTEARFQALVHAELGLAYRVGTLLSILIFPMGSSLDWITHPEAFRALFLVRWLTVAAAAMLYLAHRRLRYSALACGLALLGIDYLSVTAMTVITGGYASTHFHGMYLILLACGFLPWGPASMSLAAFGMGLVYMLVVLVQARFSIDRPDIFANDLYILSLMATIGIAMSWAADRLRRRVFSRQIAAEDAKSELEELNERLESRVAARTEDLQRALIERDEILAVVSHDLRNPITAISANANLIQKISRTLSGTEVLGRPVTRILEASQRMDRLVGDLLDLSRIEGGRLVLENRWTNVDDLVERAFELMNPVAQQRGVSLERPAELLSFNVLCDPDRIIQVFSNLIGNAVKFTPEGGRVRISVRQSSEMSVFSVEDNGSGIEPGHLPHLFDRYWQARKSGRYGVGLGLAIAQGIISAHGGRIWVESTLGEGTRVHFALPCDEPGALPEPGQRQRETGSVDSQ